MALGIGTLLWASSGPEGDPTVSDPVAGRQSPLDPAERPALPDPGGAPEDVAPESPDPSEPAQAPGASTPAPVIAAPAPASLPPAQPPQAQPPAPARAAPAAPPVAAPQPASLVVPITVLNNSRITGLAARAAEQFERQGWPVRLTGNFTGRIRSTTVYYEAGQEGSARALARDVEGIARVLPRFEGLPGSGLTVVLTRDFPA